MSFTSKTSSTKRKDAFSEELSAVLGTNRRGLITTTEVTSTTYCEATTEESGELIFTANQDFIADDLDALTLHRGEQVILLDTGCDPSKRLKLDPDLDLGTDIGSLLDNTAARHKISVRPRRKHADSRQRPTSSDERWLVQCCDNAMRQGWVPAYILTNQNNFAEAESPSEAKYQREAVIRELVETEEEFGRDIQQVVDEYLKPLDSSHVPRIVRDNKELIFNNLKQIADFHNTVLIEGLKYYANDPRMLGKTFLRLERDFDKHVTYCRDEPAAQDFLMENEEARDFFEELSQQLGDDKSLCEHLKLPIQRINDYQLLLKELVKYSKQLGEDTADLGKALELMLAVPHRANDNKFISNIEGYHGNIHKLGRLLRHDWFCVTDRDGKSKERYLFLFKARILICKVRRISEDRFVFVLKDIIRLPDVEVKDHIDDSKVFELHHKQPGYGGYPLTISAHKDKIKDFWLAEIRQYASDVLALAEHAADDLRLQELSEDNKNLDLPVGIHIEPATPEQSIPLEPREGDSKAVKTDIFAEFQKKREARTVKATEDTKKLSKTSEEKVLTEQPSKLASEQPKQTEHTANKFSEVIPVPVTEAQKLEQKVETLKAVTEQPRPVSEPPKPITEPQKPVSEPQKPVSEPQKPVSEPQKPVSDPQKPANEPLNSTENQKPVTELLKLTSKPPETVSEIPVTEPVKLESEQPEPASKRQKIETKPSKLKTELPVPILEAPELISVSPKSVSEPQKLESEPQKPIAEKLVTEPPKPTAEPSKIAAELNLVAKPSKPAKPSYLVTEEAEQKPLQSQPVNIPSSTEKTTENTHILKEEKLETESISGLKRKESPDTIPEKKVKIEEDTEMDGYSSYSSRKSGTKHVEVEEYRSVSSSSSQEVYVETASSRQQMSSGMSASQSMRMVEESTVINGQVVSHSREITGGGGGYTKIQELTAATDDVGGYTTIEEYITGSDTNSVKGFASEEVSAAAITEVQISDVKRRSSGPKFNRTIEGISIEPGERAVFECQVEEKAKVTWLKNNKPLEDKLADRINSLSHNDTRYRLEILGAHESDAGTYTARAVNESGASSCSALLLVEKMSEEEKKKREESRIPCFHVSLKDTEVLENTYLRFMVKVKGQKPDVKFYKNDRLITVANERVQINKDQADIGFYELIIPDVLQEDAGTYKCIASNRYGEAECEATVTVTDDKKIFEGLEESDLLQPGEQPNFTWLRDGQPFDPEERFKVLFKDEEDSLALVFQHVKPEDAGLYTCVATTSTGKISCSAELTVQGAVNHLLREPQKPAISTEIKKVEANINGSAMLELTVDGYPKPEVKWTKDGKEITAGSKYKILYEDEKSMSLLIKNVSVDDAGSYKVEAKNELGSDSEEITLTVKAPPKIKTKLTDYSGMAGETIKMTVEIEGEPKPEVTWYKDGKVIIKSDHVKAYDESSTSFTLLIEKSTLDDAGSYSVVASNELSQTSEFCKVEVLSPPQFISKMMKNVISKEGETIIYQVKVQGEPKPTVKWFCNGNELKSDGTHIKITEDQQTHTLTVCGVTREDTGKYTCEISNVYGKNSDDSTLNVRCSPQFRQKLTDKVAKEGDTNVEFTVNIEAFPKPNVKWFHNENEITEKITEYIKIEEGDNYKLIIKEVTTAMSGKYSCKVVNDLGSNETSATFTVHSKPTFSKGLKDIQVDEGASLTLQIEVEGTPDPVIKWYKDGEEVTGDAHIKITRDTQRVENYSMTFTLVKSSDMGEYEVRASNEMGTAITKSIVTVQTKTTMIQEDKIKVQEEKPVQKEEEKIKLKKEAKAEVEEVSVQEVKPAEVPLPEKAVEEEIISVMEKSEVQVEPPKKPEIVRTEEIKVSQETAQIEVEQPQKIVETEVPPPEKVAEEEIISVMEKSEVQVEPPKKPEIVKTEDKIKKTVKKVETSEERNEEMPDLPQKVSIKTEEKIPQQAKKVEQPEEVTEEALNLPQKFAVKEAEPSKTAEVNGLDSSKKVTIEDCEDEERDVFIDDMLKSGHADAFSCMELKAELEDYLHLPNSNAGIVEEISDCEERIIKITVSRNVSIVSISEDECSLKETPEANLESVFNIKNKENILQENVKVINKAVENSQGELLNKNNIDVNEFEQSQKTVNEIDNFNKSKKLLKLDTDEIHNFYCNEKEALLNEISTDCCKSRFSLHKQESEDSSNHQAEDMGYSLLGSVTSKQKYVNNVEEVKYITNNFSDKNILQRSSSVNSQEDIGDPEITNLLKRIQKQRNILEEILNKEEERYTEAAPEIISTNMNDKNIYESLGTKFEVQVKGVPRPKAKWYKDGEELKSSDHIKITEDNDKYCLEIINAKMTDEANYKCKVVNTMGEKTQSAQLSVTAEAALREPKIKLPLKDQSVPKNEEATMTVVLTADPIPEVKWTHDDKDVSETYVLNCESKEIDDGLKEVTYTLKILKGCHQDTGVYKFVAKNKFGTAESSARLDIVFKPEIICFKDVNTVPFSNTAMVANILANPRPDIKWSAGGKALDIDGEHNVTENDTVNEVYKLLINGASLNDESTYTVTASNKIGESSASANFSVHTEPPSIVKGIEDHSLKDYEPFEFKIRANGVPKPQIIWLKDGEEILSNFRVNIETSDEGQVSSCLSVAHFSEDDAGKYIVRAVNMAGEVQSSAKLRMLQIPPSFLKAFPRSAEVGEGEPLELKAKLDGSPIPKVKWFKDGAPLVADDHVKLIATPDGSIKLQIDNVKPTDCGAYKVVAVNPNGESTGICAVAVNPTPRRPSFSKELSDTKVTEGEPLRLEAQVMAFPAPEVKWFKDGHPVRPSPGVSFINSPGGLVGLVVDKVRPEDAGTYTLTVANKLGDTTSAAKVAVSMKEKKPQFLSQLMPSNVVEGFPAKMEIKISGHPPPQIAWTLNGKPVVPDGEHIKIVEVPDGSQCLLIDKATPADAGIYAVTAKNSQGEITSQAPLNVASKGRSDVPQEPPSFPKGLRDTTVDEETPLTFSTPFLGNPVPDVVWSKDRMPLQSSERIQFTCDGSKVGLEINPSKVSDAGVYSCKLKNPLGEAESEAKATVRKIYQKPQFLQRISDLQQLPTFDAKFWARVTGNPKPEISWYKDGNIIKDSPKYRIKRDGDTVCLYVQDCTPEDSGIYRCIASNKEGEDTCDAQLQVVDKIEKPQRKEAPAFLKKIGDCEVFKGMTAKFTACATGYPEPEAEWYREDEKLYPSDRIKMEQEGTGLLRLLISGIDPQIDAGKYMCRIFNPYGEDSCEASILYDTLDIKPRKPLADQYTDYDKFRSTGAPLPLADRPIISRMTDRRLTLSWKPSIPIGPRDPVTYHVEMCELPNGDWFTARTGVRSCACDISNLEPFRDYKFRIRVENKYGISDPSPFAQTYREKLLPDPPKFVPYLAPGIDFRPETSPYFPKDFDIERPPHDGYAQAPRFLHQEHDTQYGVKGHNCNLFWFVYGYPKPKMQYFFNDEPIEMGGRYDSSYTRNGQATLFINKMLDRDVGMYEAVATNEHGEARQRVRLEIAEYPEFIKRPDETIIMLRRSGRLEARLTGIPPPEIKWYKDWQPLAQSSRIKIQHIEPDIYILVINDAILKDEGLYSISARNIAGSISSSVMVRVEENEAEYSYLTYDKGRSIKPRTNKTLHDLYDLGDELGRGTQGITYHAVERLSGRNYAAKVMRGKGELRAYMRNELEIMNLLNHRKLIRLHDAFETPDSFMLITELAGGGELLDALTKQTFTTESEISGYIRQILMGLEHMHDLNIAHLGLTPGDLLISHAGGDDLKICDFGLAHRIAYGKLAALDYGMPEFVAPEIINGEGVSFSADMWAVGIITHLLLTGISLFRGVDDRTTLTNIKEGQWKFNEDIWKNLSSEARDFITQLLVLQPERRMDVKAALKHPWLTCADKMPPDQYQITTDTLRNYYNLFKDWYNNASCRLWYRRRPLIGAFSHPSRMVYPPGYVYTPEPSPERRRSKDYSPHIRSWEDQIPSREPLDYELGLVKSESHYQNGPDTYLLQLRDVDFPVRLREYMKVAANRAPGYSRQVSDQNHLDWKAPVIRERRRFTDVMDEEIDDERKARINKYGNADLQTMRRLRHELGTRLDTHVEADALMEAKRDGHAPFFREKPQILPIEEDKDAQLVCYAVGDPKPTVQWFKNDLVVTESNRIKIIEDETGRSILSFRPAASFDIGIYKVVARNKIGQVVARTKVVLAHPPDAPDSPDATDISDTEILLRWKQPKGDGNSPVVCYSLQYKEADLVDWKDVASNIDHEFFVIRGLRPNIAYQFRLSARNKIGWSEKGIPTKPIKTKDEGAPKVQVTKAMKHLQSLCEAGQEIVIEEIKHPLDYSIERNRIEWSSEQPTEKYNFISEIARGRYSVVVKGIDKANDQVIVAKVLDYRPDTEAQVNQEFEVLRSLRHERIAALTHAFKPGNKSVAVFILEKLQGADILTYLSSRHEYTEQTVATVVTQVLDALQYLHWRGYCHLNLEPDNIVMASVRSIQIKLVDFGAAQHVSKLGTVVHPKTNPEYTAPEILSDELAFPQSDIWSVGVLTYILLSGVSPFKGATNEETKQNINFVRFRFEHLYKEITQEATRFIMLLFKRAPTKRPTAEECHETRWLLPTEYMIKKRERAVFLGNRLKDFSEAYHSQKTEEVTKCESLVSALGGRAPITRSNSIQEELLTTV